jgi:hypothetical protein
MPLKSESGASAPAIGLLSLLLLAGGAGALLPPDVASLLTDVTRATGAVYGLRDDHGRSMDCVRVMRLPQPPPPLLSSSLAAPAAPAAAAPAVMAAAPAPLFLAVYHSLDAATATFNVHAAVSADLLSWTWSSLVAPNADMPYLAADGSAAGTGAVVLLHEQWVGANSSAPCRVAARLFASAWAVARGEAPAAPVALKPQSLSALEGTPNAFSFNALLDEVRFGLHFNDPASGRDQVAGGVLSGLAAGDARWQAWPETAYDAALSAEGAAGNIGGRDCVQLPAAAARCGGGGGDGTPALALQLQEANVGAPPPAPTNWSAWRIFALNRAAPLAGGFEQLRVATHGGSTAFGNPGVALLAPAAGGAKNAGAISVGAGAGAGGANAVGTTDAGLLVVSYFLFGEGAAPGEAGSLLFFWRLNCSTAEAAAA